MILLLLAVGLAHAADTQCAACHKAQHQLYYGHAGKAGNTMASALYLPAETEVFHAEKPFEFTLGKFRYTLKGDQYTVSDGATSLTLQLRYAFGHGFAGQTFLFEHEGKWFESRLSYYKEISRLDLTMGAPPGEPRNVIEAAGREMSPKDVTACFACHTTNSIRAGRVDFARLEAGIGCTNCHTNSAAHLKSLAPMPKLAKLTAEEQSEACGRCHRTWADIAANGPRGVNNVRFQPYRLANSKCYDSEDRRIGCAACHNPHAPLEKTLARYDANCQACHAASAKAKKLCPVGKSDCASCHMPRYEIPGSHHLFTDHMIRIVRKNDPYPN